MNVARPRSLVPIVVVFAALVLLAIACDGGGDEPAAEMATATSTAIPVPLVTPAGFLPRPTGMPAPEDVDASLERCPPFPIPDCYTEGDLVNVYAGLEMDKAVALLVETDGQERWILDEAALQEALKSFDEEVVLVPFTPLRVLEERVEITIVWPPGEGIPWNTVPNDPLGFILDPATGIIAHRFMSLQWQVPEGFADGILALAREVTHPPRPEEMSAERPNDGVYFDHPEGALIWDGPDDRLSSLFRENAHCGPGISIVHLFGIPHFFSTGDDLDKDPFFGYVGAAERSDDWRWTGYYHDAWQLWQGDDPWTVYLVHPDEDRFAFVYQTYSCI